MRVTVPVGASFTLATAVVALLVASCIRTFWKPWLAVLWIAVLALFFALMGGGVFGLQHLGQVAP